MHQTYFLTRFELVMKVEVEGLSTRIINVKKMAKRYQGSKTMTLTSGWWFEDVYDEYKFT